MAEAENESLQHALHRAQRQPQVSAATHRLLMSSGSPLVRRKNELVDSDLSQRHESHSSTSSRSRSDSRTLQDRIACLEGQSVALGALSIEQLEDLIDVHNRALKETHGETCQAVMMKSAYNTLLQLHSCMRTTAPYEHRHSM